MGSSTILTCFRVRGRRWDREEVKVWTWAHRLPPLFNGGARVNLVDGNVDGGMWDWSRSGVEVNGGGRWCGDWLFGSGRLVVTPARRLSLSPLLSLFRPIPRLGVVGGM